MIKDSDKNNFSGVSVINDLKEISLWKFAATSVTCISTEQFPANGQSFPQDETHSCK